MDSVNLEDKILMSLDEITEQKKKLKLKHKKEKQKKQADKNKTDQLKNKTMHKVDNRKRRQKAMQKLEHTNRVTVLNKV